MQFDLFENSRDVIRRNEAIDAARGRKAAALDSAIAALADECTQAPLMPPLHKLLLCLNIEFAPTLSCAQALDDHTDFAWFPAWALIVEPHRGAAARLAQPGANAAPERAARQVLSLLSLERQGLHTKLIEGRASLREKNARLFECQM